MPEIPPPPNPDDILPRFGDKLCADSVEETDRYFTWNPDPLEYTSLGGAEEDEPFDFRLRGVGLPASQRYMIGLDDSSNSFEFSTDFSVGDVVDGVVNGGESAYQFGKDMYEFGQDVEEDVNDWGERTVGGAWSPLKTAGLGIAGGMSLKDAAGGFINSEFTQGKITEVGDHLAETWGLGRGGDEGMILSINARHIPVEDTLEFAMGVHYIRQYSIEEYVLMETGSGNVCVDFTAKWHVGATGTIDVAAARDAGIDLDLGASIKAALKLKDTGYGFIDNFEIISANYNTGFNYDLVAGDVGFYSNYSFGAGWQFWL